MACCLFGAKNNPELLSVGPLRTNLIEILSTTSFSFNKIHFENVLSEKFQLFDLDVMC